MTISRHAITFVLLNWLLAWPGFVSAEPREFQAVEHQRQTIYHSPQTPGYTC